MYFLLKLMKLIAQYNYAYIRTAVYSYIVLYTYVTSARAAMR